MPGIGNVLVGAVYLLVKGTPELVFVTPIPDGVVDTGY